MNTPTILASSLSGIARYGTVLAASVILAACSDSDNKDKKKENPAPAAITSIDFGVTALNASAGASEAKVLAAITPAMAKANNKVMSAEQFKQLAVTLDGANKDLFTVEKTDTNATLTFNKAGTNIAKDTCANNVCAATITAKLDQATKEISASVTINYPAPPVVINSVSFKNPQALSGTATTNEALSVATFSAADVQINGAQASAEQFASLNWTLTGTNANLFSISKDTGVLSFNAAGADLSRYSCNNNQCAVTVNAELSGKTASLDATVSVDPVTALAFAAALEQVKALANETKTAATLDASSFTVNGQAASAQDFANISFTLDGANKDLFSINKTDASAALVFNSNASELTKTSCTDKVCTASLTATLAGQSASTDGSVKLEFPVNIKVSDLALPASHYFMMPGSGYCLRPRGTETTNQSGARTQENVCLNDTPAIYKDLKPAIPLVLLLVRDEGQTCIVTNADHSCADASVTAYTATLQQRQDYLNKYALTASELEALSASITGYADKINNQTVSKPSCQKVIGGNSATPFSSPSGAATCKLFVNKPNNPIKNTTDPNSTKRSYDINGRFSIVVEQTNYFDANGALAKNVQYIDSLNTETASVLQNGTEEQQKTNFAKFVVEKVRGLSLTRPPWNNPRYPGYRFIKNIIYPDFKEHLLESHPYKAHQALFSTRYQNIKQPMLVLNNDYPQKAIKFAVELKDSEIPAYRDTLGPMKLTVESQVQSGLVEGDRMVHTLYPLALSVQGKNTLNLNVGIASMPQEFEYKLKEGVPANSGRPVFEITKYNYSNPFKGGAGHCADSGDTALISHLREVVKELKHYPKGAKCTPEDRKKYAMDAASMPAYFGFDFVSLKEHLKK